MKFTNKNRKMKYPNYNKSEIIKNISLLGQEKLFPHISIFGYWRIRLGEIIIGKTMIKDFIFASQFECFSLGMEQAGKELIKVRPCLS